MAAAGGRSPLPAAGDSRRRSSTTTTAALLERRHEDGDKAPAASGAGSAAAAAGAGAGGGRGVEEAATSAARAAPDGKHGPRRTADGETGIWAGGGGGDRAGGRSGAEQAAGEPPGGGAAGDGGRREEGGEEYVAKVFSYCRHGRIEQVEEALRAGFDVCTRRDENGNTLLHCAAQNGLRGMCKSVLREAKGRRPLNLQNVRVKRRDALERGLSEEMTKLSAGGGGVRMLFQERRTQTDAASKLFA